jgi:hypothetical protein
MFVRIKNKVS